MLTNLLMFNLIVLLINSSFFFLYESNYRNIDIPLIKYSNKTFKYFSDVLESKFSYKKNAQKKPNSNLNKTTIKIFFVDTFNFVADKILSILEKKYNIIKTEENPDYLVYNMFGCSHLEDKYLNSTKIAFLTENMIPDFNTADYAISHSYINFLDRHFIYPYCFFNFTDFFHEDDIDNARKRALSTPLSTKKFCAALITNDWFSDYFRNNFIDELDKYKKVDMGGRYKNNIGERVKDKISFFSKYKFSIAMENTEGDGYVSEKIIESFMAGTIPIYYGGHMIEEYINPKSFVFVRGEKDLERKIKYIKLLDRNERLYKKVLKEKVFINKDDIEIKKKEFEEFINHIFEQNLTKSKRIDMYDESGYYRNKT